MKLPPLNALRAFEAAARLQSVSQAGEELHVTYSAISHQIKHLEAWFGQPLFYREGRGVKLTPAGRALSERVSEAFSGIAETSGRLISGGRRPEVTVGCIPSIASRWLVPRLKGFSRQQPAIQVKVLYAHADQRLSDRDYDVLIAPGQDPSPGAENVKLFSRVNKPVCSPRYLERRRPVESAGDIAAADLLHDETREAWRTWFAKAGLSDAPVGSGPVFEDFNLLATAVIAGHGVALCPVEVFREELARGDLVVLSDIETNADEGYFVIIKNQAPAAARLFTDWFVKAVR